MKEREIEYRKRNQMNENMMKESGNKCLTEWKEKRERERDRKSFKGESNMLKYNRKTEYIDKRRERLKIKGKE